MRIGLFSDRYLPLIDGVTYSIESFRIELEKMGHEVFIFAPKPGFRYKEEAPNVFRFPSIKGLFFDDYLTTLFFPHQVARKIDKLDLDLIHFHTPGQVGLMGVYYALHNDIPLVTTYHTDLYEYVKHYPAVLPGSIALSLLTPLITGGGLADFRAGIASIKPERNVDKWNQKLVQRGLTVMHNRCDLVIAPSRKIETKLKHWKTTSPIAVLPTGINELHKDAKLRKKFAIQFGIEPSDEVILFVGRIGTEKNIGTLIDAFPHVVHKNNKAKLMLVGTGDDVEMFKEQAAKSGYDDRVVFTGALPHDQLGSIYALADLFAFPSIADTQGLVINEAAQAGLPIVLVDKDITEVVKRGQNGYVAKNNARDLASKILMVLEDSKKAAAMGKVSKELAAGFTSSVQAAKLMRLYEKAIVHHATKKAK